jgi:hypothetical protein
VDGPSDFDGTSPAQVAAQKQLDSVMWLSPMTRADLKHLILESKVRKQASNQGSKQASKQAIKEASKQASKQG